MDRRFLAILGCVVLIGLAGCSAAGVEDVRKEVTSAADPPDNPWAAENITVSVQDTTNSGREWEPIVKDALDYWNQNMSQVGREGQFVYTDSGESDLQVRIVDEINQCGAEQVTENTHGCAPIYTGVGAGAVDNQPVRVENELQDSATTDVTIHEIGHTLGLQHNDSEAWAIMNETVAAPTLPQPNATEIANPWPTNTVRLYYNSSDGELSEERIAALETSRAYYDGGAGRFLPSNVSVVRTADPSTADIEIRMVGSISGESRSRWTWRGYDPDADGALETYSSATIKIQSSVPDDNAEWHVGYALGNLFGVSGESELPPPFDDTRTYDSSDW